MSPRLPLAYLLVMLLFACASPARNIAGVSASAHAPVEQPNAPAPPMASAAADDQTNLGLHQQNSRFPQNHPDSLDLRQAKSLLDLPVSENGEILLSEGFYEAEFKSYCLQPGTPDPTDRDAYLQMPLAGPRREILESVLRNSLDNPQLDQKDIQLLLWSIVSGSDYSRLAPSVKRTATQLLTQKQIFELKGGVMGLVKTVAAMLPESAPGHSYNQVRNLFDIGSASYEAYERIAVLRQPSVIRNPGYRKDQWQRHRDGYYVRYFPKGYQVVKVQVYVSGNILDTAGHHNGRYLLFDPVSTMAVPANSNAQRLGIGAPVVEVIRKIIHTLPEHRKTQPKEKPVVRKEVAGT